MGPLVITVMGFKEGALVGFTDGRVLGGGVGCSDGDVDGALVGMYDGDNDGAVYVGEAEGSWYVGDNEGSFVRKEGAADGYLDGEFVDFGETGWLVESGIRRDSTLRYTVVESSAATPTAAVKKKIACIYELIPDSLPDLPIISLAIHYGENR